MKELKVSRFYVFEENIKKEDVNKLQELTRKFIRKESRFTVVEEVVEKIHQCGRFKVAYEW